MAVSRKSSVLVSNANADTIAGPLNIGTIRVVGGAASSSASISCAGVTLWQSATVGAGVADESRDLDIHLGGGETLTVTLAGAGTVLYIYQDE